MMRRRLLVLALVTLLGRAAHGHLVPLDPSTCALTIGLAVPDVATATVDPPAATESLRVVYTPGSNAARSRMQVCYADPSAPATRCGSVVPRAFAVGTLAGTLVLPAAFDVRLLATGELDAAGVPVTIDVGGGPVVVTFALTSGFVVRGAALALGAPLDTGGRFAIGGIGQSDALPPPLGGVPLALDLGCTLAPAPDLDQFAQGPLVAKVRGVSSARRLRLAVGLETEVGTPPVFAGVPTRCVIRSDAGSLLEVAIPEGLVASGRRRHAGRTADGTTTVVLTERVSKGGRTYRLKFLGPPLPPGAGPATLAIETGGLFARRAVERKGKRLVAAR